MIAPMQRLTLLFSPLDLLFQWKENLLHAPESGKSSLSATSFTLKPGTLCWQVPDISRDPADGCMTVFRSSHGPIDGGR